MAVEGAFGTDVDYAQLVKLYGEAPESAKGRYSPADCTGTKKMPVMGSPDPAHISTSYIERANLTMRMHNRRFTRLTNAFSKKFENHAHMVALYAVWYNFVRVHKSLRVSPAMAANVSDRLWSMDDVAAMVDAANSKPAEKRGPYRKRQRCDVEALIDTGFTLIAPAVLGGAHLGLRWVLLTAAVMGLRTSWTNVLQRRKLPSGPKPRVSFQAGLGGFIMFLVIGGIVYALAALAIPGHQIAF